MKVKLRGNFAAETDLDGFKNFLKYCGYKEEFSFKFRKDFSIFEIKFKEKIEKNIKKFIPYIIKGQVYEKFISRNRAFFRVYLTGVDSIVLPIDEISLDKILSSREIIPFEGLKKGIYSYLKLKKIEKIHYLLILSLEEKKLKKLLSQFFTLSLKHFSLSSLEISKYKEYCLCHFSYPSVPVGLSPEAFSIFLENLIKTIYVEKNVKNGL